MNAKSKKISVKPAGAVARAVAATNLNGVGQTIKIGGKPLVAKSAKSKQATAPKDGAQYGAPKKTTTLLNALATARGKAVVDKKVKQETVKALAAEKKAKKVKEVEHVWMRFPESDSKGVEAYDAYFPILCDTNMATPDGFVAFDKDIVVSVAGGELGAKIEKVIDLRKFRKVMDKDNPAWVDYVGEYKQGKTTIRLIVHN